MMPRRKVQYPHLVNQVPKDEGSTKCALRLGEFEHRGAAIRHT